MCIVHIPDIIAWLHTDMVLWFSSVQIPGVFDQKYVRGTRVHVFGEAGLGLF